MQKFINICLVVCLSLNFSYQVNAKSIEGAYKQYGTKLESLIQKPKSFKGKTVYLHGEFHSYSTIALDYPKAYRSSKKYIGIVLARPDKKNIPLVELKLAVPLTQFKDADNSPEHGDEIYLKARVFEVALGEPWLDISQVTVIKTEDED